MDLRRDQTLPVWHGYCAAGDLFTHGIFRGAEGPNPCRVC